MKRGSAYNFIYIEIVGLSSFQLAVSDVASANIFIYLSISFMQLLYFKNVAAGKETPKLYLLVLHRHMHA